MQKSKIIIKPGEIIPGKTTPAFSGSSAPRYFLTPEKRVMVSSHIR
ncbi:MAG: hypothetical protein VZR11_09180 [Succinimonas sp.]|nr:hypothetical protein [Succinimonas sp.]